MKKSVQIVVVYSFFSLFLPSLLSQRNSVRAKLITIFRLWEGVSVFRLAVASFESISIQLMQSLQLKCSACFNVHCKPTIFNIHARHMLCFAVLLSKCEWFVCGRIYWYAFTNCFARYVNKIYDNDNLRCKFIECTLNGSLLAALHYTTLQHNTIQWMRARFNRWNHI